ncbi:MAG TPA: hypothetical protein VGO90_07815 [Chthoniobacteraceae bacterium]|jgi:hypothetical protein|nr:hypothetical protein [Chthoniobacter sp.]HEV7867573.1 hypothetical protein [Chthoniobacteraceae bacterium]
MNPDQTLDALLATARPIAPGTERTEFGFETRLLARLREERSSSWAWLAVRLSPIFAAAVLAAAAWCHSYTGIEADPTYALDAVQSGGTSALTAWLPEADR